MNPSDSTPDNSSDHDVVEIPESPLKKTQPQTHGSGLLPKLVGVLLLAAVAVLGYGSSSNWFSTSTQEAANPLSEDSKQALENLSPGSSDASQGTSPPQSDISQSTDATVSEAEGAKTPTQDLPPLDPVVASDAIKIIDECKRVAQHLYSTFPNSLEAKEMLARTEFEFGDTAKAKKVWEDILQVNPQFLYALRGLGDIATAEGNLQKAVDYYRKAAEFDQTGVQRQITLGIALTQAADLDEARKVLDAVVAKAPNHGGALAALAQVLKLQENFEDARDRFEAALSAKLQPENPAKVHLGLVQVYQRLGDREKAKQHQQQYRELTAQSPEVNENRRDYDDLDAIQQDVGRFYVDMARVYLAGGFPESASMLLLRTSRMDSTNTDCRQALAFLALQKGKPYEGIRWLIELSDLEPDTLSYPQEISRLYVQAGELDKAQEALTSFLEDHPQHAQALEATAMFFYSLAPATGKAVPYAERLVELTPNAEAYALLASIHDAAGQNDPAIAAMEKAVELAPDNEKYSTALKVLNGEIQPEPPAAIAAPDSP